MFIAAKAEPEAMYPAAAIVGFTYGGYWALIPGILADMSVISFSCRLLLTFSFVTITYVYLSVTI